MKNEKLEFIYGRQTFLNIENWPPVYLQTKPDIQPCALKGVCQNTFSVDITTHDVLSNAEKQENVSPMALNMSELFELIRIDQQFFKWFGYLIYYLVIFLILPVLSYLFSINVHSD